MSAAASDTLMTGLLAAIRRAADPTAAVRTHLAALLDEAPAMGSLHVLAVGKAALPMARAAIELLNTAQIPVDRGVITCPPEHEAEAQRLHRRVMAFGADHPLPTMRNLVAATGVQDLLRFVPPTGRLLVLLSGGGSAHLALPAPAVPLADLAAVIKALQRRGATIGTLNAVRKHLEQLKGGRAAAACRCERIDVLVLSDVLGDPLDTIASGPFAPDPTTFADAIAAVEGMEVAESVRGYLARGAAGEVEETPKPGDVCFAHVKHRVIGSNSGVLAAAAVELQSRDVAIAGLRERVEGDAAELGRELARMAKEYGGTRPAAFLAGGETTVDVGQEMGVGGPSQEAALAAAVEIEGRDDVVMLFYSTDGIDGPTDAAGAVVDGGTAGTMRRSGIDPATALRQHDSHRALAGAGALIRTGPTGTNLNHIAVAVVGTGMRGGSA